MATTEESNQIRAFEDAFPAGKLQLARDYAPEAYERLKRAYELAASAAAPQLLALAQLRLTQIIDPCSDPVTRIGSVLPAAKAQAVCEWLRSDVFTQTERACLAFTEQFAFYVADINDSLINELLVEMRADEVYGLVYGVYVFDAVERLATVLQRVFHEGSDCADG